MKNYVKVIKKFFKFFKKYFIDFTENCLSPYLIIKLYYFIVNSLIEDGKAVFLNFY